MLLVCGRSVRQMKDERDGDEGRGRHVIEFCILGHTKILRCSPRLTSLKSGGREGGRSRPIPFPGEDMFRPEGCCSCGASEEKRRGRGMDVDDDVDDDDEEEEAKAALPAARICRLLGREAPARDASA